MSEFNAVAVVFDIDGVIRDVANSYRRALADTVEHFTQAQYRPSSEEIDLLKAEGCWNNDWEASQELIRRYGATHGLSEEPNFELIKGFFQRKYRGDNFNGYIQDEPLLVDASFFEKLTAAQMAWGFFSGATRGSAEFILQGRLGLVNPCLVAMEDSPGKPNPAGLFQCLQQLQLRITDSTTIFYLGDTVADMATIQAAQAEADVGTWVAIGVIPPHVQDRPAYAQVLSNAGAKTVLDQTSDLTPELITDLL